jgi:DNA-binding transcriptional LysR family regulator
MNVHHLELFYYVAKHGGISEAVRNIPYGIQQPAVSGQIIQLEEFLGTSLFRRRPFELTAAGVELFKFIEPFFGKLDSITAKLQGGSEHRIRVGASEIVLRDHLPALVEKVRKQFPDLKLTLREGYSPQLESWLERQEIDLALTLIHDKHAPGTHALALLKLPLVLLVNKNHKLKSADELWKRSQIDEPLICLTPSEAIRKNFKQGLSRLGIDWHPSLDANSLNLIETYVASGYGIGLSIQIPNNKISPELRALPLTGFDPVTFGVMWCGKLSPVTQAFLNELQARAQRLVN